MDLMRQTEFMRNISLTIIITTTTVTTRTGAVCRIQKIKMKKPASLTRCGFFFGVNSGEKYHACA
jgi:hypothetical protein